MRKYYNGVLLALYPVHQGFQSAYHIHVGLPTRVSECQLIFLPFFGDMRVFLFDLGIGEFLANAGIELIEHFQLDRLNLVEFEVGCSFDSSFEGAGKDDNILRVLQHALLFEDCW